VRRSIGEGRCLIYFGEIEQGVALLDEAMVAVGASEVSAIATGDAYCTVIEGCYELFDIRRTREWTAALSHWCEGQPELVLYRGECLVHRAEVLLLRGEWAAALEELQRAVARIADPAGQRIVGAASFLRGELHRLRGEFADAERAYRAASELGRSPQPGLALLRLAQDRVDVADAAIRRALGEAEDPITRARMLGPYEPPPPPTPTSTASPRDGGVGAT
jgi:tetratricopeptide (TPR) repeat protein